ncbi:hypothetical protein Tco_1051968, partial [Tanacetum coccineum]
MSCLASINRDIVKSVSTAVHSGTAGVSSIAGNVIDIEHIFPLQALVDYLFVSLNFIESIKEARSRVQDLTSREIV